MPILHATHPTPDDKWKVAELWQDVFQVSNEYIDLFFNRIYKPENTFVIKRDPFIISALHVIPFEIKYYKKTVPGAYIYGAGTHPFERGQGHMRTLLKDTLIELKKRGYYVAFLIPAEPSLIDYYQSFGFIRRIWCSYETHDYSLLLKKQLESKQAYTFEPCTIKHFPYFDRKQHKPRYNIIHQAFDYETIIQELELDGGGAFAALENGQTVGMAFVKKTAKDAVFIKSILSDNDQIRNALYRHAFKLFNVYHIKIQISEYPYEDFPTTFGLVRVLVKQILRVHFPNISLMLD